MCCHGRTRHSNHKSGEWIEATAIARRFNNSVLMGIRCSCNRIEDGRRQPFPHSLGFNTHTNQTSKPEHHLKHDKESVHLSDIKRHLLQCWYVEFALLCRGHLDVRQNVPSTYSWCHTRKWQMIPRIQQIQDHSLVPGSKPSQALQRNPRSEQMTIAHNTRIFRPLEQDSVWKELIPNNGRTDQMSQTAIYIIFTTATCAGTW